jgi:hypothetical protein
MEAERRKHERRGCGFIVDYQLMHEENRTLAKRASSVNVSSEGLCIRSGFQENPNDVLLLRMPYITPNPGIFAAKIKHTVKAQYEGYYHGLYVLPLFQERFSVVDSICLSNESIDLPLSSEDAQAVQIITGKESLNSPVIEGICRFWNDLNPKIDAPISSFDELMEFLSKELSKRRASGG